MNNIPGSISGVVVSVTDSAENFRAMKSPAPAGLILIDKDTLVIKVGDGIHTWDELPTREITNISVTDSINENTGGMAASDYAVYKAFHNQPNVTDVLKSSGIYTARVTGWHDMLLIGGGGGGAAGIGTSTTRAIAGCSGCSGARVRRNVWLKKDVEYPYIIGGGGVGGVFSKTINENCFGQKGGDTLFTLNESTTIISEGGNGGGVSDTANGYNQILYAKQFAGSGIDAGYAAVPGNRTTDYAESWSLNLPGYGATEEYNSRIEDKNNGITPFGNCIGLDFGGHGGAGGIGLCTSYMTNKYKYNAYGHDGVNGVIIIRYNNQKFDMSNCPVEQINYFE